jgi:threonine dehydrogenase-like Zn-dependent dehydrogenase
MCGAYLPGGRTVELRDVPVPVPGHAQVLVAMRASTICGSDLRAIYREHLGTGPEAYQGVVAGREPAGEIVAIGPGCQRFCEGDRVALYHIAGCGLCGDCRSGYMVSCTSPLRAAYGRQRDGGHAEYLLAEESTCIRLPDELSYLDGAGVSGADTVLVTGMGPVGLAAGILARALGSKLVIGVDVSEERLALAASRGAIDARVPAGPATVDEVFELTGGHGCEVTVDCSGTPAARAVALGPVRRWGRCVFVGEGGRLEVDVSPLLIHRQVTVIGSWVTSIWRMEELVERLARWDVHPELTVTDSFPLAHAAEAYRVADEGRRGKVGLVMAP